MKNEAPTSAPRLIEGPDAAPATVLLDRRHGPDRMPVLQEAYPEQVQLEKAGSPERPLVTRPPTSLTPGRLVEQMNITATDYPPGTNEFEAAGLTAVPGSRIAAPRVRTRGSPQPRPGGSG